MGTARRNGAEVRSGQVNFTQVAPKAGVPQRRTRCAGLACTSSGSNERQLRLGANRLTAACRSGADKRLGAVPQLT
jgi:hypothetical protein